MLPAPVLPVVSLKAGSPGHAWHIPALQTTPAALQPAAASSRVLGVVESVSHSSSEIMGSAAVADSAGSTDPVTPKQG